LATIHQNEGNQRKFASDISLKKLLQFYFIISYFINIIQLYFHDHEILNITPKYEEL